MSKITALLAEKISTKKEEIAQFFVEKFSQHPALFYNSVDLRHSGFKIAPIDTNCFPGGFNNLGAESTILAKKTVDEFFDKNPSPQISSAQKILLLAESHTRNTRYFENILKLQKILSSKLKEVVAASLISQAGAEMMVETDSGENLRLAALVRKEGKIITADGFVPDLVIINNDLTDGLPEILQNLETPIIPSPQLGWFQRKKSHHFDIYRGLATEIATILNIDPWLISALHDSSQKLNFKESEGMDELAGKVENILAQMAKKYQEYGIDEKPFCCVKSDSGTYGMAVWMVDSPQEIIEINKKNRNKMHMIKGGVQNSSVIIQEGIRTIDKVHNIVAEPMIYLLDGQVVGNLFRTNETRDDKTSLNFTGVKFFDLQQLSENEITLGAKKSDLPNIYSLIARLASLASAAEVNH
jgi:glutamate--cysteine ligase